ncbi:DUF2703 domain-containing protein [Rhodococcus chondri]|uniref:DUF2703 domain-containing protein n=1 Tax=Rhodococcus chondri TaxID=3065941 RepID=A0ABU7JTB6_9NOCA|nr:DUF2703 domain-containing protein [Rhodococcus sp. CC-R104]MEE2033273.1 DUF2703 domain-containing protein [Rhodococcus sp. CC-R104]
MTALPIVWQRLVSQGQTCVRCAGTGEQVRHAVGTLEQVLSPLGITPQLEVRELGESAFAENPAESNRIWIAGRPLEEWLDADVGSSRCCSVCGDSPCRTVAVGQDTFEEIPERLVVRAALIAAASLLGDSGNP